VYVWDVVSGQLVNTLPYHRALVRDCSWHPTDAEFTTVSWDGRVVRWSSEEQPEGARKRSLPVPTEDRFDW
jgi:WD40 repeat protein